MKASNILKRQIIFEIIALLVLCGSITYAIFAIKKSDRNEIASYDGVVTVLDDSKYTAPKRSSDGVGLNTDGVTFTITNNRSEKVKYRLLISPNIHDSKILDELRIGLDDVYILTLSDLEREAGWYVLDLRELDAGYTKIHSIKVWFNINSEIESNSDIKFKVKISLQ